MFNSRSALYADILEFYPNSMSEPSANIVDLIPLKQGFREGVQFNNKT